MVGWVLIRYGMLVQVFESLGTSSLWDGSVIEVDNKLGSNAKEEANYFHTID